jgi:hypothetical protein
LGIILPITNCWGRTIYTSLYANLVYHLGIDLQSYALKSYLPGICLVLLATLCGISVYGQQGLTKSNSQLESVESGAVGTASNESSGNSSSFTPYEDDDLGFSIQYASDWSVTTTDLPANEIVAFTSPDGDANAEVKFFTKNDGETLKSFGNDLKQNRDFKILEFYRNDTTTLAGLPAIRATGLFFNQVSTFQSELGYASKTDKMLMVWTL